MPRLNFDITIEQHRQLKTLASYSGLSMKEFMLTRVFAEAAETVFSTKLQKNMKNDELKTAQDLLFKKAEIITLSAEKWAKLRDKASKRN